MARFIELRRHTDHDGDVLTERGVFDALHLGAGLTGVYTIVVSSGAHRATQTAACLLAGLGAKVPGGVVVEPRLRSEMEDRWRAAAANAGSSSIATLLDVDPSLVAEDGARVAAGLKAVLAALGHGEMALAVGHSPTNEAGVYALTGTVVEPMAKGAGVVVVEDAGGHRVERIR
ncbi:MAG: histidine phosphatase family protein [Actinobacteria bacterium]|nr:MAG: histidine phosphatase family protein [Actinomycetota bacterium]